jgi:hypothetical protein
VKLGEEFHGILTDPKYIVRFMNPGRLIKVSHNNNKTLPHMNFKKCMNAIVLFKSFGNCKRGNKGNFSLKYNSNNIRV